MELRHALVADSNHRNDAGLRYHWLRDPLTAGGSGMGSTAERRLQRAIGPAFGLPTGILDMSPSLGILKGGPFALTTYGSWPEGPEGEGNPSEVANRSMRVGGRVARVRSAATLPAGRCFSQGETPVRQRRELWRSTHDAINQ